MLGRIKGGGGRRREGREGRGGGTVSSSFPFRFFSSLDRGGWSRVFGGDGDIISGRKEKRGFKENF